MDSLLTGAITFILAGVPTASVAFRTAAASRKSLASPLPSQVRQLAQGRRPRCRRRFRRPHHRRPRRRRPRHRRPRPRAAALAASVRHRRPRRRRRRRLDRRRRRHRHRTLEPHAPPSPRWARQHPYVRVWTSRPARGATAYALGSPSCALGVARRGVACRARPRARTGRDLDPTVDATTARSCVACGRASPSGPGLVQVVVPRSGIGLPV